MKLQDVLDNISIKKVGQYLEQENAFFYIGEMLFKVEARFDEVDESKDLPYIKEELAQILYKAIMEDNKNDEQQEQIEYWKQQFQLTEQARIELKSEIDYLKRRIQKLESNN